MKDKNLEVEFGFIVTGLCCLAQWVGLWSKMSEMLAEVGTKELIGMYSLNLVWEQTEKNWHESLEWCVVPCIMVDPKDPKEAKLGLGPKK